MESAFALSMQHVYGQIAGLRVERGQGVTGSHHVRDLKGLKGGAANALVCFALCVQFLQPRCVMFSYGVQLHCVEWCSHENSKAS